MRKNGENIDTKHQLLLESAKWAYLQYMKNTNDPHNRRIGVFIRRSLNSYRLRFETRYRYSPDEKETNYKMP